MFTNLLLHFHCLKSVSQDLTNVSELLHKRNCSEQDPFTNCIKGTLPETKKRKPEVIKNLGHNFFSMKSNFGETFHPFHAPCNTGGKLKVQLHTL